MKTAVVTGASGFIGGALARRLLEKGVYVYAVGRNKDKLDSLRAYGEGTTVVADFSQYAGLEERIPGGADVFYHCAFAGGFGPEAVRDYALQLENAKYSCDAAMSAQKMGVKRFVLASTVNTVEIRSFISREDFVPRNTCIYSTGKLAAELMGKTIAHSGGMDYAAALIAMPYGEGNLARTLPNVVMEQLCAGVRPRLIEGNVPYDLVYIDDVAGGLYAMGERGAKGRNYYIGHRQLDTFRQWIERMRDVLAPGAELGFGEYPDAPALDYGLIDMDGLYRDTGFVCTADFDESIRKTAAWLTVKRRKNEMGRTASGGVSRFLHVAAWRGRRSVYGGLLLGGVA